jgi:hypothetical protein
MAYKFQKGLAVLSGAISPMADDEFDIGAAASQYKDLYIDGIAYIDQIGTDADPSTAYISAGEVDGTVIGGESAAAGTFTTLTATTFVMPDVTSGKLLVADGSDYEEVALSGDATLASGGAITIADNAVTLAKMAGLARGSIILGDASGDPSALVKGASATLLQSDGTDVSYVAMSGDATIAAGGALTIADNAVTLAKMAGLARGSLILGDASGDPSALAKGSAAQFLQSDGTDPSYVSISGDATIAAGGALTIAANAVEDSMVNDNVATGLAGVGLSAASGVMALDLNELSATAIDVANDSLGFVDAGDSSSKKTTIALLATAMAGAGITATNGVFSSDASPTPSQHGDANANLVEGMNWSSATFTAERTWTLPASPDLGDTVSVKAPSNVNVNALVIALPGSQTVDGSALPVVLTSPYAAVDFVYVAADKWMIK